jgi:hypothetical protein
VLVADLSNLVKIEIVNDGRLNVDECLEHDLLANKSQILKNGCLIDFSTESNYYLKHTSDVQDIFTAIHTILDVVEIPASKVHLGTGNLLNKKNYNTYTAIKEVETDTFLPFKSAFFKDFWCSHTLSLHTDYSSNYGKTSKPKYFSCLNGRKKIHREYAYAYLKQHNLLDKGVSTFVWKGISIDGYSTPEDITSHTVQPDNFYTVFDDTYYDIITETLVGNESGLDWWQEVFITEKVWRSIYYKRPFMVIGNMNTLKVLHDLGFKTFDNILFDETYDELEDFQMRTYRVLEQNKNIIDTHSLQDLEKIIYSNEMIEIIEHNYKQINKIADIYRQSR